MEKIELMEQSSLVSPVLINGTKILAVEGKAVVVLVGKDMTEI